MGGLCITLGVLMFFSAQETSTVWYYLSQFWLKLYWEYYRIIFSSILVALWWMIVVKKASWSISRLLGVILFWISVVSLLSFWSDIKVAFFDSHIKLINLVWKTSAIIFLVFLFLSSLYLTLRISYRAILSKARQSLPSFRDVRETVSPQRSDYEERKTSWKGSNEYKKKAEELERQLAWIQKERERDKGRIEKKPVQLQIDDHVPNSWGLFWALERKIRVESGSINQRDKDEVKKSTIDFWTWDFPKTTLLNVIKHIDVVDASEIEEKSIRIQKSLLQFNIDVTMEGESVGPTVIQYRLRPSEWVRLAKIESLKKDLTLSLKAKSIRIQAPIPGLWLVGVEVPNDKRDTIGIRELLEHPNFINHKSKLALAMGKDINGDYIVGDLAKMPHLLIAGQTGSGKSVWMNGFLLSLLYKNTPSELRMIMVDPKQVELWVYDGIPHLLTPVISSPDKALNSLKWSVAEMERRYSLLKQVWARNLAEYNVKMNKKDQMFVIVIVIDELADLMMSGNKKEVESAITRIAQKARAVGMHLILATQRPSVDVITGLIKANVPSRIAFTVASQVDSRTILDQVGAEDLLGRGDMLYFPTWAMTTQRVQWVLVETDEVERVVNHIKRTIDPEMLEDLYDASIVQWDRWNFEWAVAGGNFDEDPKVVEAAIELVRNSGKCSTSMLQRHLKLWYGRAARVVDILEEMGIVGPADGSKPREIIG